MMVTERCRLAAVMVTLSACMVSPAAGQGFSVQMGRLFDGDGWTAYSAGWTRPLLGELGMQMGGLHLRRPGSSARLYGLAADATLFRGGRPGAYAIAGLGAGFGTGAAESWWRSWSAGVGYELRPLPFISLGVEGRYRQIQPSGRAGAELSVRLGTILGPAAAAPPDLPAVATLPGADSLPVAVAASGNPRTAETTAGAGTGGSLADAVARDRETVVRTDADNALVDVIRIAEGEIGTRYQLGGTGEAGDGFDCSGLIQYAYSRIGIALPRRSVDQAREGREVGKDADELRPGDILTFSTSGGRRVTHVGLYTGDGRFIHSASKGVQVSQLSEDDPNGRWWMRRWVGSRRIVDADP